MGLLGWIDRKIVEAQTCPGCGCHPDTTGYRPGCDCLRQGCVCAGAEDDDTGGWERDPGPDAAIVDAAGGAALPPAAEPYTPDVKVHLTGGCGLCGSTEPHTHTQADWRAFIGDDGHGGGVFDAPPAAPPYTPPGKETDHRRRHNEQVDAENKRSADHQRAQNEEAAQAAQRAADLAAADKAAANRNVDKPQDSKPPGDLHDRRRDRWFDEKPITTTNTGSAGGSMASIEEVRAGIAASNEKANEGLGAVQQAHASLEEAQGQLMQATEGSGQADVSEANGLLAQAVNDLDTVRQQVSAAISAAESVANRL